MAKGITIPENKIDDESSNSKNSKCSMFWKLLREHIAVVSICALTLVIVLLIVTIMLLLQRDPGPVASESWLNDAPNSTYSRQTSPEEPEPQFSVVEDQNCTTTHPGHPDRFKIVSRLEWLAQAPAEVPTSLPTPVPYVIIHQTSTENCSSQAQCTLHVRFIQTFHMDSRNWWDIGYSFLVGGDGAAYEGRGWKREGAHTYGYNSRSIGIAFIGTFNSFKPPQRQISACKDLIARGVELGYIGKDYKLLAARQLQTTQSPGAALFEEMKKWSHWAEKP